MRALLAILTALLITPVAVAINDWPQEGYDQTHQGRVPAQENSEFGKFLEQWWNQVSISARPGSPVVFDNTVYVGDSQGFLHAVDRESGGIVWSVETDRATAIPGAPAVSADAVYVVSGKGNIYALDRKTGDKIWDRPIAAGGTVTGSLLFLRDQGLLIVAAGGTVKSYFTNSQQLKWQFNTQGTNMAGTGVNCPSGQVEGTPVAVRDVILFGSTNKCFFAINNRAVGTISATDTENVYWLFVAEDSIRSTPWIDGRVFFQERVMFGDNSGNIYSVRVEQSKTAHATWQYREPFVAGRPAGFMASGAMAGEQTIVANRNGNVIQIGLSDGEKGWVTHLGQEITGTPAIANGHVIIGTFRGDLYMLRVSDGELVDHKRVDDKVSEHPIIAGTQAIWVSDDGGLHSWGGQKPPRPDLSVESLTASGLRMGTSSLVQAVIRNVGSLPSPETRAAFTIDGQPLGEAHVPALQPGNQTSVSTGITPTKTGAVKLKIVVDPQRIIQESDRSNNEREVSATVAAAQQTGATIPPADAEEAPGPGLMLLIAILAAAVLAVHRRRRAE